ARNHDTYVRQEVETGDGARVAAHINETTVAGHQHAAGRGNCCHNRFGAGSQIDLLYVAAREFRHVGDAMRFIQRNLVNAVQSGSDHRGSSAVHIAQAEAKQCAGTFRDKGMKAIDAELNIVRSVEPAAEHGLDVSVGGHGADVACTGVGNVKLIATDAIGTTKQIGKTASDGRRYGERHWFLQYTGLIPVLVIFGY